MSHKGPIDKSESDSMLFSKYNYNSRGSQIPYLPPINRCSYLTQEERSKQSRELLQLNQRLYPHLTFRSNTSLLRSCSSTHKLKTLHLELPLPKSCSRQPKPFRYKYLPNT